MNVQLLHTIDCHAWKESLSVLEDALKTKGIAIVYEVIVVETEEQARQYRFGGSPTVRIDGVDVDPMAQNIKSFSVSSCRPYFFQGKSYDYPPKEMILHALS